MDIKLLWVERVGSYTVRPYLTLDSKGKIKRCPLLFAQIAARCSQRHEAPKGWILTLALNTERAYTLSLRCLACQSNIAKEGEWTHLIGSLVTVLS